VDSGAAIHNIGIPAISYICRGFHLAHQ
jgi:hypothetical protein